MSFDPDTARVVRSWIDEGVTELPDRVLDAVIDQLPATRQRRAAWWPLREAPTMKAALRLGIAAVVVSVVALAGINYLGTANVGSPGLDDATPTPDPATTSDPTPEGNLDVGQPWNLARSREPVPVDVTIPAPGWSGENGAGIIDRDDWDPPSGAGIITFVETGYFVYGDPCQWSMTRPVSPATTVDGLVAALSAQASRDAAPPIDIVLDGYSGKSITLRVPEDADFAACDRGKFASWGVPTESAARYHQAPGQIDRLWVVDVEGYLVVIDTTYYPGTPQSVIDELEAIVESARFGP